MIKYNFDEPDNGWKIVETDFDENNLGKTEAIFSLGNGYLGLRSCSEENYYLKKPGLFINGTYDKFFNEVSELPNAADILEVEIYINKIKFSLEKKKPLSYEKSICLQTGELRRKILWEYESGKKIELIFSRFVSLKDFHIIGQKIELKPLDENCEIQIVSGMNGQITNSGTQHFEELNYRIFDLKDLYMKTKTCESNINFYYTQTNDFEINNKFILLKGQIIGGRRRVSLRYTYDLEKNSILKLNKISNIITSRDWDFNFKKDISDEKIYNYSIEKIMLRSYDSYFEESKKEWNKFWEQNDIIIDSSNNKNQILTRFALYHLRIMTPYHDNRLNVAAKGLSGEGYKGHTFWDTEMFILPYYIWQNPLIAKNLLINRYKGLTGARKKAEENGYQGAMYPWEVAWYEDGEATPIWGAPDIVTGKQTKIWSGFIEQHITSCISMGVMQYFQLTNDQEFMNDYGYEIIFDTAKFWISRLEYNDQKQNYEINNVVGPDEYKEHVNNNSFTNHLAWWTIKNALKNYKTLKEDNKKLLEKIEKNVHFSDQILDWEEKVEKIFLPTLNSDKIMPQNDTYLELEDIDLTKYKYQGVGKIFNDYNLEQVNKLQVSKQTDVLFLFYLLEHLWDKETKKKNFSYYEQRTLHDSSLSLSTHTILASDLEETELAYYLFTRSFDIDLGGSMNTSNDGIHAAAMAGIALSNILGFCGLRIYNGKIRMNPNLPEEIKSIKSHFYVDGVRYNFKVTKNKIEINSDSEKKLEININGVPYKIHREFFLENF